ncbi:hypothetical protein [Streptomyces sp. NPDC059215]|uniref:hypothetical protein n=1 Tax=Streptomyces sp. NPDC059215 TaxID=3346772 RepID=UPI0036AD4DE3
MIEVLPRGLWVRGIQESPEGHVIRAAPANQHYEEILYDASVDEEILTRRTIADEIARLATADGGMPVHVIAVQSPNFAAPRTPSTEENNSGLYIPQENSNADNDPAPAPEEHDPTARWLHTTFGQQYVDCLAFATELIQQYRSLFDGQLTYGNSSDLASLRLYLLTGGNIIDELGSDTVPSHQAMTHLLANGLRQLPDFQGPVAMRVSLQQAQLDWYAAQEFVTTEGFCTTTLSGTPGLEGNTDVLIWSATGRRTALLDAGAPDWVTFPPGTRFTVIGVEKGERNTVLLREYASEDPSDPATDLLTRQELKRAQLDWHRDETAGVRRPHVPSRLFSLPGRNELASQPT